MYVSVHRGQMRVLDPLELEFRCWGIEPGPLQKSSQFFNHWASHQEQNPHCICPVFLHFSEFWKMFLLKMPSRYSWSGSIFDPYGIDTGSFLCFWIEGSRYKALEIDLPYLGSLTSSVVFSDPSAPSAPHFYASSVSYPLGNHGVSSCPPSAPGLSWGSSGSSPYSCVVVPNPPCPLVPSTASGNLSHYPVTAVCLSIGYVTHLFRYPQLLSTPIPIVLPNHSELTLVVVIIYIVVTGLQRWPTSLREPMK